MVLSALAQGLDLDEIAPQVGALASDHSLFPGDVLLELAEGHGDPEQRLGPPYQAQRRLR